MVHVNQGGEKNWLKISSIDASVRGSPPRLCDGLPQESLPCAMSYKGQLHC